MNFFLRARHWHLFLLMLVIPVVLVVSAMIIAINMLDPIIVIWCFPLTLLIYAGSYFGWLWTLGTSLYVRLPQGVNMNLTRFKAFLLIPVIYISLTSLFPLVALLDELPNPFIFPFVILLHFFSMFCVFYCIYFVAKVLKSVTLQREADFSDYAGEFFLLWFWFIGVWIIQPKINAMFDKGERPYHQ